VWMNGTTGTIQNQPFYNGITFHRVISGFMIQAGSPNGLGTDGPGYTFGDEFHPTLRHDAAGVLSMANSGANTNGSQFFITLGAASHLDNKHSVFGRIVEGMDVVNAIGAVPTPVQAPEVVTTIQSITISRVGTAAQAFEPASWGLPEFADAKPNLNAEAESYILRFARSPFSQYYLSLSENLNSWAYSTTVSDLASASAAGIDVTGAIAGKSKQFFRVVKASYPQQPASFVSKTLTLHLTSSNQTLDLAITAEQRGQFDANLPLGTAVLDGQPFGIIAAYVTGATLNNQEFIVVGDSLPALRFSLKFRTPEQGWFTAQGYSATDGFWPLFGTFEIQTTP